MNPTRLLPCRAVSHSFPSGEGHHTDLFIADPKKNVLCTYEVSGGFARILQSDSCHFEFACFETEDILLAESSSRNFTIQPKNSVWKALRKRDHRVQYWEKSGSISQNRGDIQEVGRSLFICLSTEGFTDTPPESLFVVTGRASADFRRESERLLALSKDWFSMRKVGEKIVQ